MSLTGDVNTLALSDLVQVSAMNRRTCQIHVIAPHAEGDLFLERGSVVHAWWGDLVGAEAVYAMLNTPDVGFHVRPDIAVEAQTIAAGWQQLVLEAARRHDHGSVPRPSARVSPREPRPTHELHDPPTVPRLRTGDYSQPLSLGEAMSPNGPPRVLWLVAAGLVAMSLLLVGWRLVRVREMNVHSRAAALLAATGTRAPAGASAWPAPVSSALVVDAADLRGAGDALPALLDGAPPLLPRSEWAVAPTIVCRLTIGSDGSVQQARVYRSRLDLAAFEDAALAAVERYRFSPALRGGAPVAVTLNWPVSFAGGDARPTRAVRIKGSDTIGGALAPALGRAFHQAHGDVDVTVEALGSKTAFVGLFDGSADLGASSRPVNADELKQAARLGVTLREYVIAYDGVAVIVHPDNPVRSLALDQIARIFSGAVADWSAVGGRHAPIAVITRPSYSGTHAFFRDKVLRRGDAKATQDFARDARVIEDNRELIRAVARDANAIAFVGNGWLGPEVRALAVAGDAGGAGVLPSTSTIRDGSYPIYRPLLFYTRGAPSRDGAAWLTFVLGAAGQAIVREQGFVPIDAPSSPIAGSDETPAGTAREPLRILFSAGGTRLAPSATARLAQLARRSRGAPLLVVGHSDAEGDPAMNHKLARARAERVAAQLVALGQPAAAISVESDDADAPIATNGSALGRHLNRRADVFLLAR